MNILDAWVAACLPLLAVWMLVSGLDDLWLALARLSEWLGRKIRGGGQWPAEAELRSVPERPIAIFVPLWRESRVIGHMLEHNIAASRYHNYHFFVGVYPNDDATVAAVREAGERFPNVHPAVCPHDGPTSKADCLNWIYQRMLLYEEEHGVRFQLVVTHDAEDLIHPESLRLINYYAADFDMIQAPVLALPTPWWEWTHGIYCDEFAEYQTKDIPARAMLGGFIPSNGVGTGFSRSVLEELAAAYSNRVFEPQCLTEDYENGFRIHLLGRPQKFIRIQRANGGFMATREYFPRSLRAAVIQRTRWVTGIALQSWERHGWREAGQWYWFWRDRKGLVGNLLSPLANLVFLYGVASWLWSVRAGVEWGLVRPAGPRMLGMYTALLGLQTFHLAVRTGCVARIYGWRFAAGVPLRVVWANWINCLATAAALKQYAVARLRGNPLVWLKTEHNYPSRAALMRHKKRLGEVLVESGRLHPKELAEALATKPQTMRLGEWLIQKRVLTERQVYEALSAQQNLPLVSPTDAPLRLLRALPAHLTRKWKVVPFKISRGRLFVASPELPSDDLGRELKRFTALEIGWHLVTPAEFLELAERSLPRPGKLS